MRGFFTLSACILFSASLSGCVTTQGKSVPGLQGLEPLSYETVAQFQTPKGKGQIRRLRFGEGYDLQMSPSYYGIPLDGVERIDTVQTAGTGRETAVIVSGASKGCPVDTQVYLLHDNTMDTIQLGNCQTPVTLIKRSDAGFVATMGDGPDGLVWAYQPRKGVFGPVTAASLQSKPPPAVAEPAKKTTPRPPTQKKPSPGNTPETPPARPVAPAVQRLDPDRVEMPPVVQSKSQQRDVTVWQMR